MKSPARAASAGRKSLQDDESSRVCDAISAHPQLLDSLNVLFAGSSRRKQQQVAVEEIAADLQCTAESLKKAWAKTRQSVGDAKKVKEPESRTKASRTSLIDTRDSRRSLRSQLMEKSMLGISIPQLGSADTSCASSTCGSPRPEDKQHSRQQRVSRKNLASISESEAPPVDSSQQQQQRDEEQQQRCDNVYDELEQSSRCSDASVPVTRSRQPAVSSSGRRASGAKVARQPGIGKAPNPEDPTRVFFECMGLTVMGFPPHVQASVKVQVSNIVHELEYELSSPPGAPDKSSVLAGV